MVNKVASFRVAPIEDLGYVLYQSLIGDKIVADLFHFLYTLKKMQDQKFIEGYAEMPSEGGIWFLKMNETGYKHIRGKWHTQNPYRVSDERINLLFGNIQIFDQWDQQKKQAAKDHYKSYHGIITETVRNFKAYKPAKQVLPCKDGKHS